MTTTEQSALFEVTEKRTPWERNSVSSLRTTYSAPSHVKAKEPERHTMMPTSATRKSQRKASGKECIMPQEQQTSSSEDICCSRIFMFSLMFVIGFNCIDMAKLAKKNFTAKYLNS